MSERGSSTKPRADLVIKNAAQLLTPLQQADFGPAQVTCIENGAVAALGDEIVYVGDTAGLRNVEMTADARTLDASGRTVTPGFVDCHTHPVFFGTREDEFVMRIKGKSYEDIAAAGGGIRASVRSLRQASKEELVKAILPRLDRFIALGTTTIEAKTGYGLSAEDEMKSLEVIKELNRLHPVDLVPTFLGAHEVPDEYRSQRAYYIDLVIKEMIPKVVETGMAEFCDIFCEANVFSVDECRQILTAAKDAGLELKIHAEQLSRNGGAALAAEMGACSADHLEFSRDDDWEKMLAHAVVPVLIPGAVFFLGKDRYAPARAMMRAGLPVAVATDFNPGTCMSESMPLILTIAALKLKLEPLEALAAATYHAALAINKGNLFGTLEVGKKADLVLWDAPNVGHLLYHFGVNLTSTVVKSGRVVYENAMEIQYLA